MGRSEGVRGTDDDGAARAGAGRAGPATSPRHASFLGLSRRGFHRVAYTEWGDPAAARVALCVHGLTRQGRDFDRLAAALAREGWRVACPDLVGRGRSGWLRDPEEYALPQYCVAMAAPAARIGGGPAVW